MTASAMTPTETLPVPVLEHPHWRVNFRPAVYDPSRVRNLADCLAVLYKTRVQLRGWDFPHISDSDLNYGDTWIAGWSDFMQHFEYWRFYQSAQFLYLGSVAEVTETAWAAKLRATMKGWAGLRGIDIETVPGFLSLTNFIYSLTEYFEFAARLAQAQIYVEPITIAVSLKGVAGFMLAADENRRWTSDYIARQPELNYIETFSPADLIASSANHALECALWFFERFGWLKPNVDLIRTDQQKLLTGRL